MISKYWLLMKSEEGRLIQSDAYEIMHDGNQDDTDCEAMRRLGERLIKQAEVLRQLRAKAA